MTDLVAARRRYAESLRENETNTHGLGLMLKIKREAAGYTARFISPVGIFPCIGARSVEADRHLRAAFARGDSEAVRSLRRDRHEPADTCWLHWPDGCLSTLA